MKVHWTKTASGHLDAIYAYIAQGSAEYALRTVDRITRRSQQDVDWLPIEQLALLLEIPPSQAV